MFYQLPPTGNPVVLCNKKVARNSKPFSERFSLYSYLYDSGTAALAAAIGSAIKAKNKTHEISVAEIILPAYACPDLISAVIFAGAKPVLVDLEADAPWLDLAKLEAAINTDTAAIVAVSLFGVAERWHRLLDLSKKNNLVLIEDSAQYFPGGDEPQKWHGDLVVISFGRGKPVSLLGGGAVLTGREDLYTLLAKPERLTSGGKQNILFIIKSRLYNLMISPRVYWLPQSMSFLHLGETRYHALTEIAAISEAAERSLEANLLRYQSDNMAAKRCKNLSSMLLSLEKWVIDIPRICEMPLNRRLLRYPILVDASKRDELYDELQCCGLGASRMYPAPLPEIEGVPNLLVKTEYLNASAFASRIITLPTHAMLSRDDIAKMAEILLRVLSVA